MLNYIVRRLLYSVLVVFGVIVLTFLFFRISAGDPAAALLGKNPSPLELENMRNALSCDRPLFFGYWRRTEAFTSADFSKNMNIAGIKVPAGAVPNKGCLRLEGEGLGFSRNFLPPDSSDLKVRFLFRGSFNCLGQAHHSIKWKTAEIYFPAETREIMLNPTHPSGFLDLAEATFFKRQASPFDSQLFSAFGEIVSFKSEFPYVEFLNFGRTLVTREDIKATLKRSAIPSLMLMLPIFFAELVAGTALGLLSAAFKGRAIDKIIVFLSVAGMSISFLVFIIAGQWYLGYYWNLFPVWGYGGAEYFILPIIVGTASGIGEGTRFYRTIFVEELKREYLRTALAKGASPIRIYCRHLLANAAIPIISRATTILPFLFTGSLLLESFFGIPGLGYAGINAVMNSDLQMLKALVVCTALIFVVVNLLADIAYAWADPRIRLK